MLGGSEQRYGISTALIACFLRDRSAEAAMEALVRFGVALFDSLGEAAKVRGAGFLSYPCSGLP